MSEEDVEYHGGAGGRVVVVMMKHCSVCPRCATYNWKLVRAFALQQAALQVSGSSAVCFAHMFNRQSKGCLMASSEVVGTPQEHIAATSF